MTVSISFGPAVRLDTDSYFPEPVTYDPFDLAFSRNLSYISRKEDRDDNSVTIGMWSFLEAYVKDRSELKEQLEVNGIDLPLTEKSREEIGVPLWYNNFEVVHIPSFQRPDVKNWLSHLDAYWRGFYQFRWGKWDILGERKEKPPDSTLRTATQAMLR